MTLVRFVTDPSVSGILVGLGFAGLLLEMLTLSVVAGAVGVAALAVFFAAHALAGTADVPSIGLAVLGLLGILFEVYVLPGGAVAGIVGAAALIGAVVLAFGMPFAFVAVPSLAVAIVVCVVLVVLAVRVVPEKVFVRRLSLRDALEHGTASPDYRALIGAHGFASSFLRPAGVAAIDGKRVDVLSEGDFVPAGTAVVVTRVEGARIFVRPEGSP
jgi:membrane-bound serine protease (ClpP class)